MSSNVNLVKHIDTRYPESDKIQLVGLESNRRVDRVMIARTWMTNRGWQTDHIHIDVSSLKMIMDKIDTHNSQFTPAGYVCTVCKINPVDAEDGIDTCESCLAKI